MPLSHDPPEFLLHKAGRRTEIGVGRTEIGRGATSRMGRIYTAATMVNGQTDGGQRTTANAAVMATRNCCRKSEKRYLEGEEESFFYSSNSSVRRRSPCSPSSNTGKRKHVSSVTPSGAASRFLCGAASCAQCDATIQFVSK